MNFKETPDSKDKQTFGTFNQKMTAMLSPSLNSITQSSAFPPTASKHNPKPPQPRNPSRHSPFLLYGSTFYAFTSLQKEAKRNFQTTTPHHFCKQRSINDAPTSCPPNIPSPPSKNMYQTSLSKPYPVLKLYLNNAKLSIPPNRFQTQPKASTTQKSFTSLPLPFVRLHILCFYIFTERSQTKLPNHHTTPLL